MDDGHVFNLSALNFSTYQNCSITPAEIKASQLPPTLTGAAIVLAQVSNLIVFKFWRYKDPYISFHISLAVASLLAGVAGLSAVILRYEPSTPAAVFFTKLLALCLYYYASCCGLFSLFTISIDRWLSVEFPVQYRTLVNQRKVTLAVITLWTVAFIIVAPGCAMYWTDMFIIPCSHRKVVIPRHAGYRAWSLIAGPVALPFLFISQMRILMIGATMKLKMWRNRAVTDHSTARPIRMLWRTVLASMTVVVLALMFTVPAETMLQLGISTRSEVARILVYMAAIQHVYSPIIYLLLFPQYRATVARTWTHVRQSVKKEYSGVVAASRTRRSTVGPLVISGQNR